MKFNSIMIEDYETLALLLILNCPLGQLKLLPMPLPLALLHALLLAVVMKLAMPLDLLNLRLSLVVLKEGLLLEPNKQLQVLSKQGLRMCCLAVSTSQRTKTHQTDDNGQDSHADYGEID